MKLKVFKCPECNATLDIDENRKTCFCSYCGAKIVVDDEKVEYTYTKNINKTTKIVDESKIVESNNKRNSEKSTNIMITVMLLILIMIPVSIFGVEYFKEKKEVQQGKVQVGSYEDLIGKDYKTVEEHFKSAGFTNIKLINLKDSGIKFWEKGEVETISIAGNNKFYSEDYFFKDDEVVISYH